VKMLIMFRNPDRPGEMAFKKGSRYPEDGVERYAGKAVKFGASPFRSRS